MAILGMAAAPTRANNAEHFGISIGAPVWNGQVTFTESVAQDLVDLGVSWIRVEFIASGDTINYTQYDEIINRANAYDLEVLGLVTYQTKAWSDASHWGAAWWQDLFRDRVVEVVQHYRDFPSGPIRFWEVWNEPDSIGSMTPQQFGRLLAVTYPAIKATDPQATVISGGLTGFWTPTYTYMRSVYESTDFQAYKAQHGIYPFDIFGQHPYHWTWDPDIYLETYLNGRLGTPSLLQEYGDGYKRIWFTEYGWNSSTTSPTSINPGGTSAENETLQANYFENAFDIAQQLIHPETPEYGPYVEKTFLFCYKDFDIGTEEWFGAVREDFTRKPMFDRYEMLTNVARENASLRATVHASGEITPHEVAQHACDGTPFTKWAALAPADDHSLTLDLGRWYDVEEFRLAHAEMGHEPDYYNTTSFAIQSSLTGTAPWATEATVVNADREPVNVVELPAAKSMRYVRLWITDANEVDGTARVAEFEVLGLRTANRPADFDDDGDVDLVDYAAFSQCLTGPGVSPAPSAPVTPEDCLSAFDFASGDGDIDLQDVAAFAREIDP